MNREFLRRVSTKADEVDQGSDFPIKDATKEPVEYLWYVGDFASFNQNCVETTRKVAEVLTAAGVDFGIIMKGEKSAGNDARRVGKKGSLMHSQRTTFKPWRVANFNIF